MDLLDLMGSAGLETQLTSCRLENVELRRSLAAAKDEIMRLQAENEELRAAPTTPAPVVSSVSNNDASPSTSTAALRVTHYPTALPPPPTLTLAATVPTPHRSTAAAPLNPLCVALSPTNSSLLYSGGADGSLYATSWGLYNPDSSANGSTPPATLLAKTASPICALAVSAHGHVAYGTMTGAVVLQLPTECGGKRHKKRVTALAFSHGEQQWRASRSGERGMRSRAPSSVHHVLTPSADSPRRKVSPSPLLLASASADLSINVHSVAETGLTLLHHLTFATPPLALTFSSPETICFYLSETAVLSFITPSNGLEIDRCSLNGSRSFDCHVSFAVLQLAHSGDDAKLVCATTSSRSIVLVNDGSGGQILNLYGGTWEGGLRARGARERSE